MLIRYLLVQLIQISNRSMTSIPFLAQKTFLLLVLNSRCSSLFQHFQNLQICQLYICFAYLIVFCHIFLVLSCQKWFFVGIFHDPRKLFVGDPLSGSLEWYFLRKVPYHRVHFLSMLR